MNEIYPETQLVKLMIAGDMRAFDELYERYKKLPIRYLSL